MGTGPAASWAMTPAGRPEIGQPINIRLGDDLLAEVDEYAAELGVSRAEAIRQLVRVAMIDKLVARGEQHRLEKIVNEGRLSQ